MSGSIEPMARHMISRRKFAKIAGASLTSGAWAKSSLIRVAAVQMTAELANIDANLEQAERLTHLAFEHGARWVILPEFFASGLAFHPDMAKAVRAIDGAPAQLLRQLA